LSVWEFVSITEQKTLLRGKSAVDGQHRTLAETGIVRSEKADGAGHLAQFVRQEFEEYLKCGLPENRGLLIVGPVQKRRAAPVTDRASRPGARDNLSE